MLLKNGTLRYIFFIIGIDIANCVFTRTVYKSSRITTLRYISSTTGSQQGRSETHSLATVAATAR